MPLVWGPSAYYVSLANVLAALLGAGVVGFVWLAVARGTNETPGPSIVSAKGELKVNYMVETGPTSASGSDIHDVSRIEFYPSCVVVQTLEGSGQVFVNTKIRHLSWRRK